MEDFSVAFRYAIQRECTLEWGVKRDCIDYNNLVFILKGKACYKIDDQELILRENQVLLIPAGSVAAGAACHAGSPAHTAVF